MSGILQHQQKIIINILTKEPLSDGDLSRCVDMVDIAIREGKNESGEFPTMTFKKPDPSTERIGITHKQYKKSNTHKFTIWDL